uniref:Uncharacterized protein n=1 Tax=Anguilla anguilla TaxID=7936 RepID=A0A0E9PGQ6_ANGAN
MWMCTVQFCCKERCISPTVRLSF